MDKNNITILGLLKNKCPHDILCYILEWHTEFYKKEQEDNYLKMGYKKYYIYYNHYLGDQFMYKDTNNKRIACSFVRRDLIDPNNKNNIYKGCKWVKFISSIKCNYYYPEIYFI